LLGEWCRRAMAAALLHDIPHCLQSLPQRQ
jgi:hypothetical protein